MGFSNDDIIRMETKAGYIENGENFSKMKLEDAIRACRIYISNKAGNKYRELGSSEEKQKFTENLIASYIYQEKPDVEGFSGDLIRLRNELVIEITQFGIITDALNDPQIDEIQANGPQQIFVVKRGRTLPYDKEFEDVSQMMGLIERLVRTSKVRLTPNTPFVDARLVDGSRVNATHPDISPDGFPTFVIRKFPENSLTAKNIIEGMTMTRNMYQTCKYIVKSGYSWVVDGITGSGKTTTNEVLAREIDDMCRTITIENPREMRLQRFKSNDRLSKIINNVVQYECKAPDNPASTDPTMSNLILNAMRQSPEKIGPGELRKPLEFQAAILATQTGHGVFTTAHAFGANQFIRRALSAYMTGSTEPAELAMQNVCDAFRFIIHQHRFRSGERRIMSITEVLGAEGLKPILVPIYEYRILDSEVDGNGMVTKIFGHHIRSNPISNTAAEFMIAQGVGRKALEFLLKPNSEYSVEEESYDASGM